MENQRHLQLFLTTLEEVVKYDMILSSEIIALLDISLFFVAKSL